MATKKKSSTRKPRKPEASQDWTATVDAHIAKGDIGTAIDVAYAIQEKRKEVQREADELRKQETAAREAVFEALKQSGQRAAAGQVGKLETREDLVFAIEDWPAYLKYAARKGNADLVQQRVGVRAARSRYLDGTRLPGVHAERILVPVLGKAKAR